MGVFLIYEVLSIILCLIIPDAIIKYKKKENKDTTKKSDRYIILVLIFVIHALISYYLIYNIMTFEPNNLRLIIQNIIILILLMNVEWITIIDTRTRIIPNILLLEMLILISIYKLAKITDVESFFNEFVPSIFTLLLVITSILFLNSLFGKNFIFGSGDIKYLGVGSFLCCHFTEVSSLLWGFAFGTVGIIIPLLLIRKINFKSVVPFGPMISIGFISGMMAVMTENELFFENLLNTFY